MWWRRRKSNFFTCRSQIVGRVAHKTSLANAGVSLTSSEFVHFVSKTIRFQKCFVASACAKVGIGPHEMNEGVCGLLSWSRKELERESPRWWGGGRLGRGLLGLDDIGGDGGEQVGVLETHDGGDGGRGAVDVDGFRVDVICKLCSIVGSWEDEEACRVDELEQCAAPGILWRHARVEQLAQDEGSLVDDLLRNAGIDARDDGCGVQREIEMAHGSKEKRAVFEKSNR